MNIFDCLIISWGVKVNRRKREEDKTINELSNVPKKSAMIKKKKKRMNQPPNKLSPQVM